MANEFRVKNGLIVSGNATVSGIVLDGNTITGVDDSGEFTDDDAHIMTSAGINDKFGLIAGSTSIVTVGTITTGTWNGTAIASAYLDADTAHLSGTQTFSGNKTFSGSITLGGHAVNDIDVATEFVDSDEHLMTSAAINDRIAAVSIADLVDDTSPQLGGDLDTNGHDIIIDDGKGIYATAISNGLELMLFQHTASANSFIQVWNGIADSAAGTLFGNDVVSTDTAATGRMVGPGFEATGSTTDVGMSFKTKGLGHFVFFSEDTTAAAGPVINLVRHVDDNAVSDDDVLGLIKFMGGQTGMATPFLHDLRDYAKIECNIVDQANSTADGNLILSAMCANTHTDFLEIGTNKTNETSAGVRAYTGSMVTVSGTGTTALSRDTHAGAYVRATGAGTFTLWDGPKIGDQVVVISDHGGTTTIDGYSNDTINGAANTTITTQYNAKTFIATSSSTWIALG
jgi:phage baseplate assembly protein gpV